MSNRRHLCTFRGATGPLLLALLLVMSLGIFPATASAAEHRLGVGLLFFDATDDLGNGGIEIETSGAAGVLSYQYRPRGLLKFEFDVEIAPDGYAGSNESTISPVAWVLVGKTFYAGAGVGISFASDFEDDFSEPFFAARVGVNILLLPRTRLDVNANYRANAFSELDDFESDAITLGAMLRFTIKN